MAVESTAVYCIQWCQHLQEMVLLVLVDLIVLIFFFGVVEISLCQIAIIYVVVQMSSYI